MKRKLNILIACEESQTVCKAFRELGQNAFSCDLFDCSGEIFGENEPDPHPEWHFNHDVTKVLDKTDLTLQNGEQASIQGDWDIMIAHPPCTFLAVSGAQWYYHPEDKDKPIGERRPHPKYPNRANDREDAVKFFMLFADSSVRRIAIENPVGIMSTRWRKPDQQIQPYMFGDPYSKMTCLWLKGLNKPHHSRETEDKGERVFFESGKSQPKWYSECLKMSKEERQKARSKTFPGIARAMAEQWTIQTALEENLFNLAEYEILGEDYPELRDKLFIKGKLTDSKDILSEVERMEQELIQCLKRS